MPKRVFIVALTAMCLVGGLMALAQGPKALDLPPLVAEPPALPVTPAGTQLPPSAELPPLAPGITNDDPMQVVEAFVARNRKEAEDSIQALTQEAETLRARLQKVEAALERWKAVDNALKQAPAGATGRDPIEAIQKK